MVKFLPFDKTTALLAAGQDSPVAEEPEPVEVDVGPESVEVVLEGVQFGS